MERQITDEQLLRQFASGQTDSLGELARRYELPLLGLACGMLGGRRDLALDAVQETWMRVIRFSRNFNHRSTVKTWLYRITINQCKNLRNKSPSPTGPATSVAHTPPDPDNPTPDRAAEATEETRALHEALDRLGPPRRSIVLLCYHAGMTHEQAAEILEIPLGTLKSRLHAALEELRAALSAEAFT